LQPQSFSLWTAAISNDAPLAYLHAQARRFADAVAAEAATTDRMAIIPDSIWMAFDASGLGTCALPTKFGGCDLWETRHGEMLCSILRMLGAADLSIARLFEGHVNAIGLVCRYGTAEQIADLANDVAAGALSAVWGADDAIGLKAATGEGSTVLQGRKILASGAGFVTRPLVTASGPDGQQMYLLELAQGYPHDISGWQAQGMRATATGTVDFTGTVVGARERIGAPGDYMEQPTFSGGAWRFCAAHLGALERLVDLFRQHLAVTKRGEDAYQLERLAQCVAAARTARFWVEDAARRLAGTGDAAEIVAITHLTRMTVERSALAIMETVQRGIGLRAFVRPHDAERISRDLATYLRQPAPDLAMSDAARSFLSASGSVGDL
jgi:alkylation response protein AidB-like acyl-CoA dehydrogenase